MLACGYRNHVATCDLGIFVDQAAEPFSAQDADSRSFGGWAGAPGGRLLVERPVWPVGVVVIGVLAEDEPQMPFTSDQHPVQTFAAGAPDLALGDRVRARRRTGVLTMRTPAAVTTASKAAVNLVSRSRIRNLRVVA